MLHKIAYKNVNVSCKKANTSLQHSPVPRYCRHSKGTGPIKKQDYVPEVSRSETKFDIG